MMRSGRAQNDRRSRSEVVMRAAIFRKGELVVDTIADPVPTAGQVLVKTLSCGICGSDLHVAKHTRQFVDVANRAGRRWVMDPDRDVVFGHEFCCEVVEHGPGTPKRLKPGTLVCSIPLTVRSETVAGYRLFQRGCRRLCPIHAARRVAAA